MFKNHYREHENKLIALAPLFKRYVKTMQACKFSAREPIGEYTVFIM